MANPARCQVNYGLLTDARGCPVAVSVFGGNTADSKTFMPAVQRVRENFGLQQVVGVVFGSRSGFVVTEDGRTDSGGATNFFMKEQSPHWHDSFWGPLRGRATA